MNLTNTRQFSTFSFQSECAASERVLKLTCTALDMLPLAAPDQIGGCNFTTGSFQAEYAGRLNKWDEAPARRAPHPTLSPEGRG